MRYLVTARPRAERRRALDRAIDTRTLGRGSIAGGEYLRNMAAARELDDGRVQWVETCFCREPLDEERPYWEEYFSLLRIVDAHARTRCRHETGEQRFACQDCDCTAALERRLAARGRPFCPRLTGDEP